MTLLNSTEHIYNQSQNILPKVRKSSRIRPENSDICFCINFDRWCQKLIFGGEKHTMSLITEFK